MEPLTPGNTPDDAVVTGDRFEVLFDVQGINLVEGQADSSQNSRHHGYDSSSRSSASIRWAWTTTSDGSEPKPLLTPAQQKSAVSAGHPAHQQRCGSRTLHRKKRLPAKDQTVAAECVESGESAAWLRATGKSQLKSYELMIAAAAGRSAQALAKSHRAFVRCESLVRLGPGDMCSPLFGMKPAIKSGGVDRQDPRFAAYPKQRA